MYERKSLQVQAYEYLKEKILNQELDFDTIYSETKISKDIGVSRTPMRNAIQYLEKEKYIDIMPNKGFMLHKMSMEDFVSTFQIRCAIEGYAARQMANQNKTPEGNFAIKQLENAIIMQEKAVNKSVKKFLEADTQFHYALVAYTNNQEFANLFEIHMYQMKNLATISLGHDGRKQSALLEHREILQYIKEGNASKAYESVLFHMENPRDISIAREL